MEVALMMAGFFVVMTLLKKASDRALNKLLEEAMWNDEDEGK